MGTFLRNKLLMARLLKTQSAEIIMYHIERGKEYVFFSLEKVLFSADQVLRSVNGEKLRTLFEKIDMNSFSLKMVIAKLKMSVESDNWQKRLFQELAFSTDRLEKRPECRCLRRWFRPSAQSTSQRPHHRAEARGARFSRPRSFWSEIFTFYSFENTSVQFLHFILFHPGRL